MKKVLLLLSIISLFLVLHAKDKMIFAIELANHGHSKEMGYNSYQLTDDKDWIKQPAKLLPEGERQQYIIGRYLRKELMDEHDLLAENYNEFQTHVHVLGMPTCLSSAHAQLIGLYPPGTGPQISQNQQSQAILPGGVVVATDLEEEALPYFAQPFAIHARENSTDDILDSLNACPQIKKYEENTKNQNEFSEAMKRTATIRSKLKADFKLTEDLDLQSCYSIYNEYNAIKASGVGTLATLDPDNYKLLQECYVENLKEGLFKERKALLLNNEPLFKEFSRLIKKAHAESRILIHDTNRLKFAMFIGRDLNIASAVMGLGNELTVPADFGASLILEIYKEEVTPPTGAPDPVDYTGYYVNMTYNGKDQDLTNNHLALTTFLKTLDDLHYDYEKDVNKDYFSVCHAGEDDEPDVTQTW